MHPLPEVLAPAHLLHRRRKALVLVAATNAVAAPEIAQSEEVQATPPVNWPVLENQTVGRFKPAGSFFNLSWTGSSSTV